MTDAPDQEKIMDCLFDPDVSSILSELEGGPQDSAYLSEKLGVTAQEIASRLSYLIQHGLVEASGNGPVTYRIVEKKLAEAMEHDENYSSAVDGITQMDSFLN